MQAEGHLRDRLAGLDQIEHTPPEVGGVFHRISFGIEMDSEKANRYADDGSNPITNTDPKGLDFGDFLEDAAGIVVGAAATAGCEALTGGTGTPGCVVAGTLATSAVDDSFDDDE